MLNKLKNKFLNSESSSVFKGMITLAMGSSAARIISIASTPIITRLYSPEDFGLLALYTSLVVILVPFATLRYTTAIPLPKTDAIAINLIALGLLLITILSVLIGVSLFIFGETILAWFNMAELAQWWWLILLGMAGSAIYELFSLWSTRKRKYKVIAKTQFTQSLIGNSAKILLGWLLLKPFGLILGQFLSQSAGVGGLVKGSVSDFKNNYREITWQRIKFVSQYYREFPYFRLPSQLLLAASVQAPILMMAALYSKETTGQLSLAMMALTLPAGLIGSAMAKAFYGEIAVIGKRDLAKIKRLTLDVQKKLFIVGVPLTVVAMLMAEPLFSFVFGEQWALAGKYASYLAPFILLQLTTNPLVQVLNVLGSQKVFLAINIIRIVVLMLLFLLLKYFFSIEESFFVIALSCYLTTYYLLMTLYIYYMVSIATRR